MRFSLIIKAGFLLLTAVAALPFSLTVKHPSSITVSSRLTNHNLERKVLSHQIEAGSNQYCRVTVKHDGNRVKVELVDPNGNLLEKRYEEDSSSGSSQIRWISKQAGTYTVVVKPVDYDWLTDGSEINVDELRPVRANDRLRLIAERSTLIAERHYQEDRFTSALNEYAQAIRLGREADDHREMALGFDGLGDVYRDLGDSKRAVSRYKQALDLYESASAVFEQTRSLNNLGAEYLSLGEPTIAFQSFRDALKISRNERDRQGEALSLKNLGVAYHSIAETQRALDCLYQALAISRSLSDHRVELASLITLGNIYADLNEPLTAKDFLEQARIHSYKLRDLDTQKNNLLILTSLAQVHRSLGDNTRALELLKLVQSQAKRDRRANAQSFYDMGTTYADLGNRNAALAYFRRALSLAREIRDRRQEARVLSGLGATLETEGKYVEASRLLTQALTLTQSISDRHTEANTLYLLAEGNSKQGRMDESLSQIEQALKVVDSIRDRIGNEELRSSYWVSTKDYYDFYIDLLMRFHERTPQAGYDQAALQASEQSRSSGLLNSLNQARFSNNKGVNPTLLEEERALREQLSTKATYQLWTLADGGTNDRLAKEFRQLSTAYEELRTKIALQTASSANLTEPLPLSAKEIQTQLADENTLLLEYSIGEERSYLWAVSPSSISSYELPGRERIEQLVRTACKLLTLPGESNQVRYWKEASDLSQVLLGPVSHLLGEKRLLIVSDAGLRDVPFEALPVPRNLKTSSEPDYLIVRHEITYLPSASTLAMLKRAALRRPAATEDVAILADPVISIDDPRINASGKAQQLFANVKDRTPRLLGARWEAETISRLTTQNKALTAVGFSANRDLVMNGDLDKYKIIHIATHGVMNDSNPELSGILLSSFDENGGKQNGVVLPQDIYGLKLSADLVVLSACDTALGDGFETEGMSRLSRSFMYAGAQGVVTSLWKVDDTATADLMARFYKGMLQDGLTPSAALRRAKLEMRSEKRWQSPYYWAAFTLQGDGQRDLSLKPSKTTSISYLSAFAFPFGLCLVGITLFWRRIMRVFLRSSLDNFTPCSGARPLENRANKSQFEL
jgi:CHAT domain-containing protein/Flp pilus assembly protein TadD